MTLPVDIAQIREARGRLDGRAHLTPIFTSRTLDEAAGARVFLKCENMQRAGAFKFRGAFNAVSQLGPAERERGVIAYSSGNHAQAVAFVSRLLGVPATVVMPVGAPRTKRAATAAYGATIVDYDPQTSSREDVAAGIQRAQGLTLIPPFDHVDVIAGQGTVALELHEQVPDLDLLVVPCGGGGLLSGCAIATRAVAPTCRVVGIEPALGDDATRTFRTGTLHTVHNPATIADGTRTSSLGTLTMPIVLGAVDDMQTVDEADIISAVRFAFFRLKLVVEPSGALGIAALLSGAVRPLGRVGVVVSGGNIDAETMVQVLGSQMGGW
jgi:threo-3-hydroxy-L-aspartate ammonia-lyase